MSATDRDQELLHRAQLRVGTTLARKYRVERVLGVGGMASVYEAVHRNGRRVAIKILHPELSIRADIRERFLRESHAANAVTHRGAVAVMDEDVAEDGAAFLVMELLAGHSVEEVWERQGHRLSSALVIAIAHELCDVMIAAHAAGIIHRDIKPANLFITHDGRLKVLDFGIARVRHAATQLTDTGLLLGTPAFMAPEQAAGRTSQIDERTDLWAIGATMFTLLTGRPVHEGETAQHVVMLAATQPARALSTLVPELPIELAAIVDRALSFEKTERWSDGTEMRTALSEASAKTIGVREPNVAAYAPTLEARVAPPPATSSSPIVVDGPAAVLVLGTTTSRAVSSRDAIARPHPNYSGGTLLMRTVVDTCVSLLERIQIVVGGTGDATPISELAPTIPRLLIGRSKRLRAVTLAVTAAAAVAATTTTLAVSFRPWRSAAASEGATPLIDPPPPTGTEDPRQPAAAASSLTPLGAPEAAGAPLTAATGAASAPRISGMNAKAPQRAQSAPAMPRRSVAGREPSIPSGAPASTKPDCSTPFVIDSTGKTIWRRECL